jgi:hypothetical protein
MIRYKQNKYRNKKTIINNIVFDSKKEAKRYSELKLKLRACDNSKITDLKLQPRFLLQKGYVKNGKKIREINYIADFSYTDNKGNFIIEDVKGKKTKEYLLKKKMFGSIYPELEIKEI